MERLLDFGSALHSPLTSDKTLNHASFSFLLHNSRMSYGATAKADHKDK